MRALLVLALWARLSSHAWAVDSDDLNLDREDEAPPMAKKAKRKPRAPLA